MACHNCDEIAAVERRESDWAVARLTAGYVWLNATQYYRGACFYVARTCAAELHELDPDEQALHLREMASVAAAVQRAVGAPKMNYEALGNSVPHLHWWLTPRHHDDPRPRAPIWENLDFLRLYWTGQCRPTDDERDRLRLALLDELANEPVTIERSFVSHMLG